MSKRNLIEEIEARIEYIPKRKIILGLILLIPPISILGMGLFTYELYQAGKKLQEEETGTPSVAESDFDTDG
ncbi:hypothetical protein [Haloarcula argentinensis]|uniref:Uncharacterized protein n=1 Tax=Haloarcula argentinensis TaxID=43776 RepID=A0ABU2F728_HALAR|nr:hypothetical protein [Haloarcula argentinensis]MDS0255945.1 hypothetical protein [Haloarcula argentinensis]